MMHFICPTALALLVLSASSGLADPISITWVGSPSNTGASPVSAMDSGPSLNVFGENSTESSSTALNFNVSQLFDVPSAGIFDITITETITGLADLCDPSVCLANGTLAVQFQSNLNGTEYDDSASETVTHDYTTEQFIKTVTQELTLGPGNYTMDLGFMGSATGLNVSLSDSITATITDPVPEPALGVCAALGLLAIGAARRLSARTPSVR